MQPLSHRPTVYYRVNHLKKSNYSILSKSIPKQQVKNQARQVKKPKRVLFSLTSPKLFKTLQQFSCQITAPYFKSSPQIFFNQDRSSQSNQLISPLVYYHSKKYQNYNITRTVNATNFNYIIKDLRYYRKTQALRITSIYNPNYFKSKAIHALSQTLPKLKRLQHLDIALECRQWYTISDNAFQILFKGIFELEQLTDLSVVLIGNSNFITFKSFKFMANEFSTRDLQLKKFKLGLIETRLQVDNFALKAFSESLTNCKNLTDLCIDFKDCNLDANYLEYEQKDGYVVAWSIIPQINRLQSLDLSFKGIYWKFNKQNYFTETIKILDECNSIKKLRLDAQAGGNTFKDSSLQQFSECKNIQNTLEEISLQLDFGNNHITDQGIQSLNKFVKQCKELRKFELHCSGPLTKLNYESVDEFLDSIQNCQKLESLIFRAQGDEVNVSGKFENKLWVIAQGLPQLEIINLNFNKGQFVFSLEDIQKYHKLGVKSVKMFF